MGPLPFELLVPLNNLKFLNLSGNHLVNVTMQLIYPLDGLEVKMYFPSCRFHYIGDLYWTGTRFI